MDAKRDARRFILTALALMTATASPAARGGSSPLLDGLAGGQPQRAMPTVLGAPTSGRTAEQDAAAFLSTLHCRADVLEAFDMLRQLARYEAQARGNPYYEAAMSINLNADGSLAFVPSRPAGEDLCQTVEPTGLTIAIAHTHSDEADAVKIPVGADCDSRYANYVVTNQAVFVTVPHDGSTPKFSQTGSRGDLGSYRQVWGRSWRDADRRGDPDAQAACRAAALSPNATRGSNRCYYDEARARLVRSNRGISCRPAAPVST